MLTERLLSGLALIARVIVYGPPLGTERASVISFNIEGMDPSEVSLIMDQSFEIATRPGLHCAPDAHRSIGTLPQGTVRLSLGFFNTVEEVDKCLEAITMIVENFI